MVMYGPITAGPAILVFILCQSRCVCTYFFACARSDPLQRHSIHHCTIDSTRGWCIASNQFHWYVCLLHWPIKMGQRSMDVTRSIGGRKHIEDGLYCSSTGLEGGDGNGGREALISANVACWSIMRTQTGRGADCHATFCSVAPSVTSRHYDDTVYATITSRRINRAWSYRQQSIIGIRYWVQEEI